MASLTFMEMFGGIGGFRLGLEPLGFKHVWYNDKKPSAVKVYNHNFRENWKPLDVRRVRPKDVPDFDILTAGFPCQPFSMMGKRLGFKDVRGTLFFEILRFLEAKEPPFFILENVEGLVRMKEFQIMLSLLGKVINGVPRLVEVDESLDYYVWWKILDLSEFGSPQRRRRVFIVGSRKPLKWRWPKPVSEKVPVKEILEKGVYDPSLVPRKIYCEITPDSLTPTLIASYGNGGLRTFVIRFPDGSYRMLTVREAARLQTFPDWFEFPVSRRKAYELLGNAVPPVLVKEIGKKLKEVAGG